MNCLLSSVFYHLYTVYCVLCAVPYTSLVAGPNGLGTCGTVVCSLFADYGVLGGNNAFQREYVHLVAATRIFIQELISCFAIHLEVEQNARITTKALEST